MNNKTTIGLSVCVVIIFAVIGIGFITSRPAPTQTPAPVVKNEDPLPNEAQLQLQLAGEQPAIHQAITTAFPTVSTDYTIDRAKLYHRGEWYGAILQYKGSDTINRDTLRIVLQKKNGTWIVRSSPPQILISKMDIPNAPNGMIDDLNKPAALPGTDTSPAITPGE